MRFSANLHKIYRYPACFLTCCTTQPYVVQTKPPFSQTLQSRSGSLASTLEFVSHLHILVSPRLLIKHGCCPYSRVLMLTALRHFGLGNAINIPTRLRRRLHSESSGCCYRIAAWEGDMALGKEGGGWLVKLNFSSSNISQSISHFVEEGCFAWALWYGYLSLAFHKHTE